MSTIIIVCLSALASTVILGIAWVLLTESGYESSILGAVCGFVALLCAVVVVSTFSVWATSPTDEDKALEKADSICWPKKANSNYLWNDDTHTLKYVCDNVFDEIKVLHYKE